jgi:heme-degrading monooxygenase HmoA
MYAVAVRVSIKDRENAQKVLEERVVPGVSGAPGFVAAYWTRSADGSNGLSMLVFESEDAAQAMADRVAGMVPEGVTFDSAEVREVVASA